MSTTQSAGYNGQLTKEILDGVICPSTRLDNRSAVNITQVSQSEQYVTGLNLKLLLFLCFNCDMQWWPMSMTLDSRPSHMRTQQWAIAAEVMDRLSTGEILHRAIVCQQCSLHNRIESQWFEHNFNKNAWQTQRVWIILEDRFPKWLKGTWKISITL